MKRPLPADAFTREETYAATRLPVELATTLIPDAYTEQSFFDLERERVFAHSWTPVCVADEVTAPGDFLVVEAAGRSVIVCRNRNGELRAHHNVCRHRGSRLCDPGAGRAERFFKCPYHSWAYDLDGRCLGTPLFTPDSEVPEDQRGIFDMSGAKAFDKADYGLYPVRCEQWGFLIFICLDHDAPRLLDELGELPERLAGYRLEEWQLERRLEYDIAANWKLIAENFMEYYHLPWVHPSLVKVSPMNAHYRWQGAGKYVGFCTTPIASNADGGGWLGLPAIDGLAHEDAVSARFAWLFPNIALNVLPNHVFLLLTRPAGPNRTTETAYLLTHPQSRTQAEETDIDALVAFWDEVNREDIAIVERVQDGLSNPAYLGGRMCYRFEESVHRFQNMEIDRMLGIWRVPEGDREERVAMFPSATPPGVNGRESVD
ncbi:MAG: choline monooxygenase [Gaiellales bacterium]|nr:choline monooxygenase [Gaiellales bacterium]